MYLNLKKPSEEILWGTSNELITNIKFLIDIKMTRTKKRRKKDREEAK